MTVEPSLVAPGGTASRVTPPGSGGVFPAR